MRNITDLQPHEMLKLEARFRPAGVDIGMRQVRKTYKSWLVKTLEIRNGSNVKPTSDMQSMR